LCVGNSCRTSIALFSAAAGFRITRIMVPAGGAITSIFAVFAQYRISGFLESIRGGTFAESWSLYHLFKTHHHVLSWVIAVITIWGALVWGYGDLLLKYV